MASWFSELRVTEPQNVHKNSVYLMELLRGLREITLVGVLDFAKCCKISPARSSERMGAAMDVPSLFQLLCLDGL